MRWFNFNTYASRDERIKKDSTKSLAAVTWGFLFTYGVYVAYEKIYLNASIKNIIYPVIMFAIFSAVEIYSLIMLRKNDERITGQTIKFDSIVSSIFTFVIFIHLLIDKTFVLADLGAIVLGGLVLIIYEMFTGSIYVAKNKKAEKEFKVAFIVDGFIFAVFTSLADIGGKYTRTVPGFIAGVVISTGIFYILDLGTMKISNMMLERKIKK